MFVVAILQVSAFSSVGIGGGGPDVLLVTLVSIALLRGAVTGAVAGFAAGLIVDVATLGTLGVTSLLLTLAGYWAGRYGETTGRSRAHAPLVATVAATVFVEARRLRAPLDARRAGRGASGSRRPAGGRALERPARLPRLRARPPARRHDRSASSGRGRSSSLSDAPYGERRNTSPRFLPPDPSVSAPYRLTPGLAVRVGVLGVVALAVFAVLFFRLWSLQVLSGARYLDAAQNNQLRTIRVEAPRGPILDRNGKVIVGNVPGTAVKLWVGDMPKKEGRYRMIKRLAAVLDVPTGRLAREVDGPARRSADADHGEDGRPRRPGLLPAGARVRVPRRADPADVPARLPVPVARRADPRLRRRDLARGAEAEAGGRRPTTAAATRSASRGSRRRSTSICGGTSGAAQIRVDSLRPAAEPARDQARRTSPERPSGSRSTSASSARPSGRSGRASRSRGPTSSTTSPAARSSRSTRATAPCGRWRRSRPTSRPSTSGASTPTSSPRS